MLIQSICNTTLLNPVSIYLEDILFSSKFDNIL